MDAGRLVCDGLTVDNLITELGILVKPLNQGLDRYRDFQGIAIMGRGRLGLVLNAGCPRSSEVVCN
jgi:chemotaxis protein histidine kinase CheA